MRTTRAWRLRRGIWRVRRSVPRVARPLSRLLPRFDAPERPVLVLGCPRSGTSALLQGLLRSDELRSVQSEGHILWDEFHHPRERGWDSDALSAEDVTERERAYVYCAVRLFIRGRRFIDKTPESCLRADYLEALFPDATFIFLRRRAAPNIASLLEAWRARPRFVKYRLPEPLTGLGELSGTQWSFALVPGWRALRDSSLEEICAAQYAACNEAALAARERIGTERWLDVSYEDLVAQPVAELHSLYEKLGLTFDESAREYAANLSAKVSRTALDAPRDEKWRERQDTIERMLPGVTDLERRLGYA
jgi:hypothetical protein